MTIPQLRTEMADSSGDGAGGPRPVSPELIDLCLELGGDVAMVDRFVDDYLQLLDRRLDTIGDNLVRRDREASYVSLLSLESTSTMIGATATAAAARRLRLVVTERAEGDQSALWRDLLHEAGQTRRHLQELGYGRERGTGGE